MSAPIRITLGVPNDSKPIPVSVASNKQRRQIDVTAPIVEETLPTYEGPYSVTPSESVQTLETAEKAMTDDVSVGAIPADYVGSEVPRKSSADLTASGPTVTAPAGYYAEAASKTIPDATYSNNITIGIEPYINVTENGLIGVSKDEVSTLHPITSGGYAATTDALPVGVWAHNSLQLPTQVGRTITPTESEQTAVAAQKFTTGEVKVAAIPSDYIGSEVPQKSSTDLTASGATVTVPSGYYAEAASKSVAVGSVAVEDTTATANPTITVSTVGRISASYLKTVTVTPTVTDGYVTGGESGSVTVSGSKTYQLSTQSAKTVTPTESEQTAVESWKYTVGEVKVGAISSSYVGSGVTRNDSTDLSVSGATVTAPAGYYENAASASVPNATWKNASTVGVVPEISVDSSGLITANCAGWTSIHPLTASGYADSNTAANIQLSGVKTSQLSTQAAQTITPTTTNQTIASGKYLTGAQTILGDANLVPESIVENITIFGVTGNAPPPVTVVHLL